MCIHQHVLNLTLFEVGEVKIIHNTEMTKMVINLVTRMFNQNIIILVSNYFNRTIFQLLI